MSTTRNVDREKFQQVTNNKEEEDKFEIFVNWLKENGTKFPKLELKDYGDEVRGCHTTVEVENDEIIVEVPLKCLITVEMGKDTEIGKAIIEKQLDLDAPKHIFLMIFMLIDKKNPDSFFKPYYDILPATLNNMPIFWNAKELGYLEGSYILSQIDERNQAIESDYANICHVEPGFIDICTLEEFKWARMCVCSRNFGLIVNGVRTAALVPYADMLNHYRPRESKWQFDDSCQGFTITSLQNLSAGVQIYDSYGQKCNHRFLLNYGFSIENNVEPDGFCPNEVPILLQLKRDDPLYDEKFSLGNRDPSFLSRRIRISVCDNDNIRNALAMFRIIEADREDLDNLYEFSSGEYRRSVRDAQIAINIRNEIKVLNSFNRLCRDYLSRYPSTFDEDAARLADSKSFKPFSNEKHAVIQVKGEKEVLLFYIDFTSTALKLLNIKDENLFEEAFLDIRKDKHIFVQQYCRGTIGRLRTQQLRQLEMRLKLVDFSRPTVV